MNQSFHGEFAGSRRNDNVYAVLSRYMIGGILVILVIGGAVILIPLLKQRHKETAQIERLQTEIAGKKRSVVQLRREVELLRNDPAYIELKARDRLDLMKPGETIVRLESLPSPAPARSER